MTVGNDSLSHHNGFKFGTFDKHHAGPKCASKSGGGWWYDEKCAGPSNLNAGSEKISWAKLDRKLAAGSAPKTTDEDQTYELFLKFTYSSVCLKM